MTRSKKKKAEKQTTDEVLRRLFPGPVRKELKKEPEKIRPLFPKRRRKQKS